MKKVFSFALAAVLAVCAFSGLAATAKVTPKIESVEYKGHGAVEVDFVRDVRYRTNSAVTVTDESGESFTAEIISRDEDDLTFDAADLKAGKYSFTISGIRVRGYSTYYRIKSSFTIPESPSLGDSGIELDETGYDYDDRELSVEFRTRVEWKSPKAKVTDKDGKSYTASIIERDSDDIEIRVKGLTYGEEYTLELSGVRKRGEAKYTTINIPFLAVDD